jgi:hypothetical protein
MMEGTAAQLARARAGVIGLRGRGRRRREAAGGAAGGEGERLQVALGEENGRDDRVSGEWRLPFPLRSGFLFSPRADPIRRQQVAQWMWTDASERPALSRHMPYRG